MKNKMLQNAVKTHGNLLFTDEMKNQIVSNLKPASEGSLSPVCVLVQL